VVMVVVAVVVVVVVAAAAVANSNSKAVPVLNQVPCHDDILCLIKYHTMQMYVWGVEVQFHTFLISVLDGGEESASCSSCFTPIEQPLPYL